MTLTVKKNTKYYYEVESCDEVGNCQEMSMASFKAGQDVTAPTLELEVPEKQGKKRLKAKGTTEPGAYVKLYINGTWVAQEVADSDGEFSFNGVVISSYAPSALLKFISVDAVGFQDEEEVEIMIDFTDPVLKISDLPSASYVKTITLNGSIDQTCDLTFYVSNDEDTTPPKAPSNLTNKSSH